MESIRSVPLGPSPASADCLRDMYVQLQGEDRPFKVKAIIGETQHERVVAVTPLEQPSNERRVPESDVLASWHSAAPLPEPKARIYKNFVVFVYPQDFADQRRGGNRYVVLSDLMPHKGFKNAEQLASWTAEVNLDLPMPAPDLLEGENYEIGGQYRRAVHCTTLTFEAVDGIRTRDWDNGTITAAQCVTDMKSGEVTLHVVGPNCTAREKFDRMLWPRPGEEVVVYAEPGDRHIYDIISGWQEGVGPVCRYSGKPLAEIRQSKPNAKLYTLSEATDRIEQACVTPVQEISAKAFDNALDCLPPEGWVRNGTTESFKFAERYSGLVTSIYARIDDRFFMLRDRCTMRHAEIIDRVQASRLLESPAPDFEDDADTLRII